MGWVVEGVERKIVSHLIIRYRDWLWKERGRVDVSGEVLEKKILRDGARQGVRFLMSLYKDGDCFLYFFLSRRKGSERRSPP